MSEAVKEISSPLVTILFLIPLSLIMIQIFRIIRLTHFNISDLMEESYNKMIDERIRKSDLWLYRKWISFQKNTYKGEE